MKNLILFLALLFSAIVTAQPPAHIVIADGFESGDGRGPWQPEQTCNANAITSSTAIKFFGNRSLKFTLDNTSTCLNGPRTEKYHSIDTSVKWFSGTYYIDSEADWTSVNRGKVIAQWHKSSGPPSLAISIYNRQFRVEYRRDGLSYGYTTPVDWPIGQRITFIVHYVPRTDANGITDVWYRIGNGPLILYYTYRGPNYFEGANYPYVKYGIYAPQEPNGIPSGTYNIYVDSVMLGNSQASLSLMDPLGSGPNTPPTVSVNSPVITLNSANTANLSCTASDPGGSIATYNWTQVSGPNTATIATPSSASTAVNGLIIGTYVFRITVTDNLGATATADVTVLVNNPPTIAFDSYTVNLLTETSVTLNATLTDPDGNIANATKLWTQVEGPNTASFSATNTASTTISGLIDGLYTFRLTVTDEDGGQASAEVTVYKVSGVFIVSPKSRRKTVPQ